MKEAFATSSASSGVLAMAHLRHPLVPRLPRVLVVDDTEDNLLVMTAVLEDAYEVVCADSGEAALAIATGDQVPDLILLDVVMPHMDGHEVMRRLRGHPGLADVPVIFLTARSGPEDEQLGLDLGAVDYIAKPISPPIVKARVRSHLERAAQARQLRVLSQKLSRYLPSQVYQSLFDGSSDAEIRTCRKKLTVFFSDIKDFTATTAKWQPEDITFLLNSYFSEMSTIVAEYGGTLDKFIGDAMVVFFGDPCSRGVRQDAVQCVRMALAMQRRMAELHQIWQDMGIDKAFQIRIGINTGYCDVGNFGSTRRMEYTIIGPEVNLAARLEQAGEAGGVLIASSTWALVRDEIEAQPHEPVIAKGFPDPIRAYAVTGLKAAASSGSEAGGSRASLENPQGAAH